MRGLLGMTPPAAKGTPPQIRDLARRHKVLLQSLELEVGAGGFLHRESRTFDSRGVKTELLAEVTAPIRDIDLKGDKLASDDATQAWLKKIASELVFQSRFALTQAEGAINALLDIVLRPAESQWLGGEVQARKDFLNLPPRLAADAATATARRIYKEVQGIVSKERAKIVEDRVRRLSSAKMSGKVVASRYHESLPFLSTVLELELTIEKSLDQHETERLVEAADDVFAKKLDEVLASTRKALVARVQDQLVELTKKIKTLPHVELLTDADIATTVEPYYGGLNRALKKRRARSAFVAVEERAREAKYTDDVGKLNERRAAYANVATYYPLARSIKRELVLYVGPTNSGKTWRALNDLVLAGSGAYLAPLRLLALEGQEEIEKRGKPTSFITGEERDLRPDALFVSSTIEMLNLEKAVDAVVIDEVQLLADERRGWAWLAAVVGAPASKVIMTGSPDVVELVRALADYLGETLTVHECQRHNELRVAPQAMRLREVRPGMAIVCFSRRDVLRIKSLIQENSEHKVAVVYGNLSPQVRREEARRFRTGEADILVATDAIAMGLNLPISEVLFSTTEKFNGEEMVELTPSEIRQIGGRAGRFGFAQFGVVNALDSDSLELIREAIQGTGEILQPPFFVAPGHNHIRIISEVLNTTSLERILTFFERAIEFSDERFARSNIDELSYLSTFVDQRLPFLDVTQRMTIACAPVAIRNETVLHWFLDRILPAFPNPAYPDRDVDQLDDLFDAARHFETGAAANQMKLRDAEDYLKTLTVYAWLAYRYPDVFTRIDDCEERREAVNAYVERSLRKPPPSPADRAERGNDKRRDKGRGGKGRGRGRR